ncbi:YraN family protein [Prosthecobacter sp. SYSU 5D2]|uniref:YraN family protein n=1 Tax=Prosthecobacter sp. SYSU 5D2 TaxID=3134134 RepID=UPI0031FF153D
MKAESQAPQRKRPLPAGRRQRLALWLRRRALAWKVRLHSPYEPMLFGHRLTRAEVGIAGELLAAKWLGRHGRKVLKCNHDGVFGGELDIVARHGEVLTFVEVKTRTQTAHGRPADAVNAEKRQLIRQGALAWLRLLGNPKIAFRFDIVEVLLIPGEKPAIHVIENAFTLPDYLLTGR